MIRISNLFHIVFKENPKACFAMTLELLFWDLKGTMHSHFKVTTEYHFYTIRTGRSKVTATRSTTADDLNLWVRSQSHKWECLSSTNSDKRAYGFGAACGHMSKYCKR